MAFSFDTKSQDFKDMMIMADEMAKEFNIDKNTLLENLLKISYHETEGTYDHTIKQTQGKPGQEGMGLFQFELGKGQGGHTAINRLLNHYETKEQTRTTSADMSSFPAWLQKNVTGELGAQPGTGDYYYSSSKGFDASTFSPSQQFQLMIADLSKDLRKAGIKDISNTALEDLWIDYHWAGSDPAKESERRKEFQGNMNIFNVPKVDSLTQSILDQLINYP